MSVVISLLQRGVCYLCTILLNDIKDVINYCRHHCYADDTQLFKQTKIQEIKDCIDKINADLNNVANFSVNNCLQINAKKVIS